MKKPSRPKPLDFNNVQRLNHEQFPSKRAYYAAVRADAKAIAKLIDHRFLWLGTKRPDAFSLACDLLGNYSAGADWRIRKDSPSLSPREMAELLASNKSAKAVREALRVAVVNAVLAIE